MRQIKFLLFIVGLWLLTSCNNHQKNINERLYYSEFYSTVNDLISSQLKDVSAIAYKTMPVIKPFQIPAIKIVDSIASYDPPPFGVIQYNWLSVYPLAIKRNLNSKDVDFMYNSIDPSKIIQIDSNRVIKPVITEAIYTELFQDSGISVGYNRLKRKYGSSCYISVSTPIFNSDFSKVIISINYSCGPLWGNGYEFILEKKKGKWEMIEKSITWES
jgi:hypothetical protein